MTFTATKRCVLSALTIYGLDYTCFDHVHSDIMHMQRERAGKASRARDMGTLLSREKAKANER